MTETLETTIPLARFYKEHHGLLKLSWRVRQGQEMGIDIARIRSYITYIWTSSLKLHFEIEERHIFPILGNESELVQRAMIEHRWIQKLILSQSDYSFKTLNRIEERLEGHIRFEEKILFPEFQKLVSNEQCKFLESLYSDVDEGEQWEDQFWL